MGDAIGSWQVAGLADPDAKAMHAMSARPNENRPLLADQPGAGCADPARAEGQMLEAFCSSVSAETHSRLYDPKRPLPFANLEWPPRVYKRHGIKGAKATRARMTAPSRKRSS